MSRYASLPTLLLSLVLLLIVVPGFAPADDETVKPDMPLGEGASAPSEPDGAIPDDGSEPAEPAVLQVHSEPSEAAVYVDGELAGSTPALDLKLVPGDHEITIVKAEHVVVVQKLSVVAGESRALDLQLVLDVPIPHHISLKHAPKFVNTPGSGSQILKSLLVSIVHYYVDEHDPRDLLQGATEALVKVPNAVRAREVVLRGVLSEEARNRIYLEELDLRGYSEISFSRRDFSLEKAVMEIEAGEEKLTVDLNLGDIQALLGAFDEVFDFVDQSWDKDGLLTPDMLYHVGIQGMLGVLDDEHSHFLPPSALEELQVETSGTFGGLGIVVGVRDRQLTVIAPIDGTPAYRAGLLAGDIIVDIDGDVTHDLSLAQAVKRMRGEPGTKIQLAIKREGRVEPLAVEIVRAIIKIRFLRSRMLEDGIGYLRLTSFISETLDADVSAAIDEFQKQGLKSLVIDLRSNPGGLLDQAGKLADLFVSDGTIVSTRSRGGAESRVISATSETTQGSWPMVVLVDRGSASASEILSGVLQDYDLALIIGEKTYGKGSVQRVMPIDPYNVAFALTVATYHLPSGRTPHKVGIIPDLVLDLDEETRAELASRSIYDKEWDWDPETDPHLARALPLLREWVATGQRPDIAEPDSSKSDEPAAEGGE